MKVKVLLSIVCAFILWGIMFSRNIVDPFDFWLWMVISTGVLVSIAFSVRYKQLIVLLKFKWLYILQGAVSALLLYLIFWVSRQLLVTYFPSTQTQIQSVYLLKNGHSVYYLIPILLLWVGPAEELFWRGFIQEELMKKIGYKKGYVIASLIYALVHIWAMNLMLFIAALFAGLFWGFIFMRQRKLWPLIISHSLWDVLVFCLWPLQ